jgi:hypothetical protein
MVTAVGLVNGFVPVDTTVEDAQELERVLSRWARESSQPTVGDVGAFGGSPVLSVRMGADEFLLNRDTKRAAVRAFLDAAARARGADNLPWHVTANSTGTINRVSYRCDDEATPGWYAYLREPSAEPRQLVAWAVTVVQFVHPGFEYYRREHVGRKDRRSGVMPWKPGNSAHDRKFMLTQGSMYDPETDQDHRLVPLGFWGEWEGPSVYWRLDSPGRPLPRLVHAPFRPINWPTEPVQNTDPMVFGDAFVYSNCRQCTSPSLRTLSRGSLVLFGRSARVDGRPSFNLDTCLVVDRVQTLRPVPVGIDNCGSDLLTDAVLSPLHSEGLEHDLTVYFGRCRSAVPTRPFSFFPARLMYDSPPLFARPELRPTGALQGVINPGNMQGIKVTAHLSVIDRDAIWAEIVRQVNRQGCGLGYYAAPPAAIEPHEADTAAAHPPTPLHPEPGSTDQQIGTPPSPR